MVIVRPYCLFWVFPFPLVCYVTFGACNTPAKLQTPESTTKEFSPTENPLLNCRKHYLCSPNMSSVPRSPSFYLFVFIAFCIQLITIVRRDRFKGLVCFKQMAFSNHLLNYHKIVPTLHSDWQWWYKSQHGLKFSVKLSLLNLHTTSLITCLLRGKMIWNCIPLTPFLSNCMSLSIVCIVLYVLWGFFPKETKETNKMHYRSRSVIYCKSWTECQPLSTCLIWNHNVQNLNQLRT